MLALDDFITPTSVFGILPMAPTGKGRPRFSAKEGKVRAYTPKVTKLWSTDAHWLLKAHRPGKPFSGPVTVALHFAFERPKNHFTKGAGGLVGPVYHTQKPDLDNLEKMMLDCLVKAGIMVDDTQVVEMYSKKTWLVGAEFVRWVVTPIQEAS